MAETDRRPDSAPPTAALSHLVDPWIPSPLRLTDDVLLRQRARIVVIAAACASITTPISILTTWSSVPPSVTALAQVAWLLFLLTFPVLWTSGSLRYAAHFVPAGLTLFVTGTAFLFDGGIPAFALVGPVVPVMSVIMCKPIGATCWSGATAVGFLVAAATRSGGVQTDLAVSALYVVAVFIVMRVFRAEWTRLIEDLRTTQVRLNDQVTEQRGVEATLREAQRLESLGMLAGAVAHGFNNLLQVIDSVTNLSHAGPGGVSEFERDLNTIRAASTHAHDLTRQLASYAGRTHGTIVRFRLGARVADVIRMCRVTLPSLVRIQCTEPARDVWIRGVASQIDQLLLQLLQNAALSYGPDPSEATSVRLAYGVCTLDFDDLAGVYPPESLRSGRYAFLRVSDRGSGIPPEHLERIFDPFFTTRQAGQGLGLATVLGTVRSHRGGLRVKSALGEGTTITVYLPGPVEHEVGRGDSPRTPARTPAQRLPETDPVEAGAATRAKSVLLVDDEALVRLVLGRHLVQAGHRVVEAAAGAEAFEAMAEVGDEITAVILDSALPDVDGLEVFRTLRKERPELAFIFATGYASQELVTCASREDNVLLLRKPFPLEALDDALASFGVIASKPAGDPPPSRVAAE